MNIAEKFAELSIASSKLTKKKQQTKKKIEYVSTLSFFHRIGEIFLQIKNMIVAILRKF